MFTHKTYTVTLSCGHVVELVNTEPLGSYTCRVCRWEQKTVAKFGPCVRYTGPESQYMTRAEILARVAQAEQAQYLAQLSNI